jgi:hypothetical protein
MQYQLARYHAGEPIPCRDGTHPMPDADCSPFVLGIERFIDENQAQNQGTKFRICVFPSELSNGSAVATLAQYGKNHKGHKDGKISRKDAKQTSAVVPHSPHYGGQVAPSAPLATSARGAKGRRILNRRRMEIRAGYGREHFLVSLCRDLLRLFRFLYLRTFAPLREIFLSLWALWLRGSRYFDWMGESVGRILPVADSRCPVASTR